MKLWRDRLGDWRNQPGIVLGGGPSVKRLKSDLERLQNRAKVIAVNRSLELPITPDIWLFSDGHLWQWMLNLNKMHGLHRRVLDFEGHIIGTAAAPFKIKATQHVITARGAAVLGHMFDGYPAAGRNTGWWGLNWLYCMGCDPLVLIGFDCTGLPNRAGQSWWHDGYGYSPYGHMDHNYNTWANDLYYASLVLDETQKERYNLSPGGRPLSGWTALKDVDELLEILST